MDNPAPADFVPDGHRRPPAKRARLTERDLILLEFAAEHRVVLAAQVGVALRTSAGAAAARLRLLTKSGYMRFERKFAGPGCYLIDRRGLGAIGSRLPRPRDLDPATYEHDLGLGWLWLAAHRGWFGALDGVVSEREMRSHDGRLEPGSEPLGVRLGGVGPRGGERRHYPDLLVRCRSGHRVAIELELTGKSRADRERILGGYAVDFRIDAVLYLTRDLSTGRAIERSAAALVISARVIVQRVQIEPASRAGASRAAERAPHRSVGTQRER
jgi:hypothetical protein